MVGAASCFFAQKQEMHFTFFTDVLWAIAYPLICELIFTKWTTQNGHYSSEEHRQKLLFKKSYYTRTLKNIYVFIHFGSRLSKNYKIITFQSS